MSNKPKKNIILVVEDESAIRDMIRFTLHSTDFMIVEAENTKQAKRLLIDKKPNLILLDWMLPGKSGIDFIRWQKQQPTFKDIPVILLTAKAEEEHKIKGLTVGADDYIIKPFSPKELIARIKTILRRGPLLSINNIIQVVELKLNTDTQQTTIGDQILNLTPIEYRLLLFFLTHQNRTYSRDQLLTRVWGGDVFHDERTVDVQIRRLRNQLKPYGYHQCIQTVRGIGYQFNGIDDEK